MKLFSCQTCGNVLYFENRSCGRCGSSLGYDPEQEAMLAFQNGDLASGDLKRALCANAAQDACNWLVPKHDHGGFCLACRHNGTVPDLSVPGNTQGWRELEIAKHRLFYSLLRWRLPLHT